jgi:hypothetical protein
MSLSRPSLRLAASQAAPRRRLTATPQMSQANAFDGRGRQTGAVRWRRGRLSANTVTFATPIDRDACMDGWRRFCRAISNSRTDLQRRADVTFQTACNWYDGKVVPTGDKMLWAATEFPREFQAIMVGRVA